MEQTEKKQGYTTITLPTSLMEKVEKAIEKGGFSNRVDFIRDAIRKSLENFSEV